MNDSSDVVRMLACLLSDDAEISFASSGRQGLEMAWKILPDLILLEVDLPEINGLTLCRMLKADAHLNTVPVLFLTAGEGDNTEVSALEAGAIDFIAKPLCPPVVSARVNAHLALRKQTLALLDLANLDGLTGVYNRRYFDTALEREVARQRRNGHHLCVAMIDVDFFKAYNDCLGHQQGDMCLRTIARSLSSELRRPSDLFARYGGEEFAVIAPDVRPSEAPGLGAWIKTKIEGLKLPHPNSPTSEIVTGSVGLGTLIPSAIDDGNRLVALADRALYLAKQAGRNRHVMYTG